MCRFAIRYQPSQSGLSDGSQFPKTPIQGSLGYPVWHEVPCRWLRVQVRFAAVLPEAET